ncbi:hypothetical protein MYSTI_02741 [Myxococcus stipitatus DSM 14675]|uniref:Uncharacterized protein n=1 Tax=Myxococcus stipitatus (strain DSM 14675 / JCM 12634 / Mx s8) TaxID=1278073 RepID=L7U909_MYXSD|nr:hypothetical protein [Myxococcus stipitatus]AGC44057.1 hypothetical protein MYSTI_02741 [Myxococcus stipitatus DSM 14675]
MRRPPSRNCRGAPESLALLKVEPTAADCHPHGMDADAREYLAIQRFYGQRRARRSGVLYLQHIDEGLWVLRALGATEQAQRAYCLHPLVQEDDERTAAWTQALAMNADLSLPPVDGVSEDPRILALALDYRETANAALSHRPDLKTPEDIALSKEPEVNDMLRADKVQNYKDFIRYHRGRHPRSAELEHYFQLWLARLDVTPGQVTRWHAALDRLT